MEIHKIHTSYLICATPRTGSFLLCEALKNTGLAGCPEEFFPPLREAFWCERWGVTTYADFLQRALREGTTANGIFGAKVMWNYFPTMADKLRQLPAYASLQLPALLRTVFPNLHYIFITRQDKVRQAVSYWKALQNNGWAAPPVGPPDQGIKLRFSFKIIDYLVREIEQHEQAWWNFFAASGSTPFVVLYEDFVDAYEATARAILQHLSIPAPPDLKPGPRHLIKQANALSEKWVQQYFEIKQSQVQHDQRTALTAVV